MSELKNLIIIQFNKYDVKKHKINIPEYNETIQDLHNYVCNKYYKPIQSNMIYYINNGTILDENTELKEINKDILLIYIESLVPFQGSSFTNMINQVLNSSFHTPNLNTPILNLNSGTFNLSTQETEEADDISGSELVEGGPGFNDPIPQDDEHFGDDSLSEEELETTSENIPPIPSHQIAAEILIEPISEMTPIIEPDIITETSPILDQNTEMSPVIEPITTPDIITETAPISTPISEMPSVVESASTPIAPETTSTAAQEPGQTTADLINNILNPNEFNVNSDLINVSRQLLNMYGTNINYNEIKDTYSDEYTEMLSMGFTNSNRVLQALQICEGDIEKAINYYLSE